MAKKRAQSSTECAAERRRDPRYRAGIEARMTETHLVQNLIALRESRGFTQAQLAKRARVNQRDISMIERQGASALPIRLLLKVAAALGARVTITVETYDQVEAPAESKDAKIAAGTIKTLFRPGIRNS